MKTRNIIIAIMVVALFGCSKVNFLNEKPNKALVIPSTLEHLQALLDRDSRMNGLDGQGLTPQLGESGADNFYLLDNDFNTYLRPQMQNYFIWAKQPYDGVQVVDWEYPYRAILTANIVIDGLKGIEVKKDDHEKAQNVKGQALFHRGHLYFQLAQVFAPPFIKERDNQVLSIPLRLSADINEPLQRSTVKETYELIISDLKKAIPLLDKQKIYKHRPSKQAGYALLSRVYLVMRQYQEAKLYADSCLLIQYDLLNYNSIDINANSPFSDVNGSPHPIEKEIIFNAQMLSTPSQRYPTTYTYALVDTILYASYCSNDLRKYVFFQSHLTGFRFKGSYRNLAQNYFSGLAVNEVLLNRAEANIRLGSIKEGLSDLNRLLSSRWKDGTYIPYENQGDQESLNLVLKERRKELLYRGLRWSDIRRLNLEGYDISVKRNINDQNYILLPDDPRWVWPFPLEVITE